MHSRYGAALLCCALVTQVFVSGCASGPYTSDHRLSPSSISRNNIFRYTLPAGWFDATPDSTSDSHIVWLVRDDYAASITVNEVHIDGDVRRSIIRDGLGRVAQVSLALMTSDDVAQVLRSPEASTQNGNTYWSYEVMRSTKDILRVVLVDTGRKVYEVVALVAGRSQGRDRDEVFSVQQSFLRTLQWQPAE